MPGSWHECHLSVGLAGRGATILEKTLGNRVVRLQGCAIGVSLVWAR